MRRWGCIGVFILCIMLYPAVIRADLSELTSYKQSSAELTSYKQAGAEQENEDKAPDIISLKRCEISRIEAQRKGFSLQWAKGKVTGYQIEYSLDKNFAPGKVKQLATKKNSKVITGLKARKTYYVRIRSYKKEGEDICYSPWSKVRKVKTCKYLIVIDPGHQKKQNSQLEPIGPGASSRKPKVAGGTRGVSTGKYEYQLNLEVALKLEKELKKRGYEVIMVRKTHKVNIANSQRAKIANKNKADAFIRIHANGAGSSQVNGAMTLCMTSRNPYNRSLYKKSYRLSSKVLNSFVKATGCRKQGVSCVDNMSGINWSKVPVTILEMGYMSNPAEDRKMATSSYQKKMTIGIANGIDAYFK